MLKRIAILGGSFNPPGLHHRRIVEFLLSTKRFDEVRVLPCGLRQDKEFGGVTSSQRAEMLALTFSDLPGVVLDLSDIAKTAFTRTIDLDARLKQELNAEITHVIGGDLVRGGAAGSSEIQTAWHRGEEVWQTLKFAVLERHGFAVEKADLPPACAGRPHADYFTVNFVGSSTEIRERRKQGRSIEGLVMPAVARYIEENNLYRG